MRRNSSLVVVAAASILFGAIADGQCASAWTYRWTGAYIGGYFGGVWGTADVIRNDFLFPSTQTQPSGIGVGGLLGYNFQTGPGVFGIEGDAGWLHATGSSTGLTAGPVNQEAKVNFAGRVRGRVGLALDRVLPFAAGGISFGHQRISLQFPTFGTSGTIDNNHTGWNVGGGVDYAFGNNWVGRIEYIYDQFSETVYGFAAQTSGVLIDRNVKLNTSTVRAAIILRFAGR